MDWSGVDYCDVFIRLSFWRHPFTAEHPLLRHWCRDTFLQTWWRNKLIYITDSLRMSTFSFSSKLFLEKDQWTHKSVSIVSPSCSSKQFQEDLWWFCFSLCCKKDKNIVHWTSVPYFESSRVLGALVGDRLKSKLSNLMNISKMVHQHISLYHWCQTPLVLICVLTACYAPNLNMHNHQFCPFSVYHLELLLHGWVNYDSIYFYLNLKS